MHEYSMVQGVVEAALEQVRSHNALRATRLKLEIGDLAFLADGPLHQAFGQLTAGTELEGAELVVERVHATLVCPGCGHEGPVALPAGAEDDHHNLPPLACPDCGELPEITSGSGVVIRDLELEVEDTAEV